MPEYRTVTRTVMAHQYKGGGVEELSELSARHGLAFNMGDGTAPKVGVLSGWLPIVTGDWLVRAQEGFELVKPDRFAADYVPADGTSENEVVFRMKTVDGAEVRIRVEGWTEGRDAAYAMIHTGRPEVVLEFLKEQVHVGDMSVLRLMNEMAALTNPHG